MTHNFCFVEWSRKFLLLLLFNRQIECPLPWEGRFDFFCIHLGGSYIVGVCTFFFVQVVINQTASFSIGRKKAFSDICFVGLNLPRIEAEDAFFHSRDEATSGTSPDIATGLKITPPIFLVDRKQSDGGTRVRVAPCFPDGDSPRMFFEKKHGTRFSAAAFSQNGSAYNLKVLSFRAHFSLLFAFSFVE